MKSGHLENQWKKNLLNAIKIVHPKNFWCPLNHQPVDTLSPYELTAIS